MKHKKWILAEKKLEILSSGDEIGVVEFCRKYGFAGKDMKSDGFKHFQLDIKNITNFIINRFSTEVAITDSFKDVYLVSLLNNKNKEVQRGKKIR